MTRKDNGRRHIPLIIAGASVLLLGSSCGRKQGGAMQRPPSSVVTAPAVVIDAPLAIDAFGRTRDTANVDLVAQVTGILVETLMGDGATVTNGQVLFRIDPRDYEAQVRRAEALVTADQANLVLARSTLERTRTLIAQELVSREEFDTLQARVDAAAAQLEADTALLDKARLDLARCTVTAPMAGICSTRYVNDGNLVVAAQTRLTNIRSYDPIYVDFSVPDLYVGRLREAMAAGPVPMLVTPRGSTNGVAGTVEFIENTVSVQTGTIMLRGQVPNPDLTLWAGQFVDVYVVAGRVPDAVMVPESAVLFGKQGAYLYVMTTNSTVDLRPAPTGIRHENQIQILHGVAGGEKVVTMGQLMLFPGAPVGEVVPGAQGKGPPPSSKDGGGTRSESGSAGH
jgi:RND family efflux transporter MFP subunit